MPQRHVHDDVERLWPGAADPRHPRFVPIELRDAVEAIPADVEQKMRRELYGVGETSRIIDRDRAVTVHPASDPDDLETALVWRKNEWAARHLDSQRFDAEFAANDARNYTCQVCRRVLTPDFTDRHSKVRTFADGRQLVCCAPCFGVADSIAVAALAAEKINGRTRAELAAALLERTTP